MNTAKEVLLNQVKRKLKFLINPLLENVNSVYNNKVMNYAKLYKNTKVDAKKVLYQVRDGQSMTDSPYAIFKYLLISKKYKSFKHIWVVDSVDSLKKYKKEYKKWKNVDFVIKESREYLEALVSCKYLINNSTFPGYFTKKENQVYINTWHGTPLKFMGLDVKDNLKGSQNTIKNFLAADYLLTPNAHTTKIFKDAFKLNEVFSGKILETGYPRIDLTVNADSKIISKKLSHNINLKDKRKILYCPTWRGEDVNNPLDSVKDICNEIKILEEKLDYQILLKVHPFIYSKAKNIDELKKYLVPDSFDANELMSIVDIMITDYSSIFFDYLVTEKPIIFYVPDYEEYKSTRGLYISENELPGPIENTIKGVIDTIKNKKYDCEKIREKYTKFKNEFVYNENGKVTERVVEEIFTNKKMVSKSNKKKILFYSGGMKNNGITTSLINLLENIDYEKYDVTIFLNNTKNHEVLNNINQLNSNVRIIFRKRPLLATLKELYMVSFIKQRGINNFLEKFIYPRKVYEREFRKIFGDTEFDCAIDFSGYSMFWANLILASNAKKKFIYLHSDIKADMERKVNGVRPHYQNLKGVISLYPYFDRLINVSDATKDLNIQKFNNKKIVSKQVAARNTINISKIKKLMIDDSDVFEKNNTSVLVNQESNTFTSVEFSKSDFKIVTVGRLSPEKGFDLLIKSISRLVYKYPKLKLYILGDGPLKEELKNLISKLDLERNVFLLGQRKNPFYIMSQSDLFALTSHYEGQSMVILEALTTETHVLASDIVANRYVLEDEKYGMLVNNKVIDISKGIEQFINKTNVNYKKFDADKYNELAINEFYKLL
ncbi:glycosyltransferase [Staphylococcus felis]|uniref:Teichoic acid biosynthesis protein n=2 Tax=Staphylococcus felis TaxID=46127 RepID=A0A3E0ILG0_9STAP|nr:glycosyltransferase [Staphylococcus felis]REH90449.1 teichoic acid biosynthesis protein [Staphylococcus felis]